MQSVDIHDQVVQTVPIDLGNPQGLVQAIKAAQAKGAVQHVISQLPMQHEIVRIQGLKYEVVDVDEAGGQMVVRLLGADEQKDSHDERRHSKRRAA